jgi:hypothetical protein
MQREQADYLHVRELGGLELLKAHYHQTQFSKQPMNQYGSRQH